MEVDLLVSHGGRVWCYEAKDNAAGLKRAQFDKLLELARTVGARPGIAAVEGDFAPEFVEGTLAAAGQVLTRERLLT